MGNKHRLVPLLISNYNYHVTFVPFILKSVCLRDQRAVNRVLHAGKQTDYVLTAKLNDVGMEIVNFDIFCIE
jgi:hypothetical protein